MTSEGRPILLEDFGDGQLIGEDVLEDIERQALMLDEIE